MKGVFPKSPAVGFKVSPVLAQKGVRTLIKISDAIEVISGGVLKTLRPAGGVAWKPFRHEWFG